MELELIGVFLLGKSKVAYWKSVSQVALSNFKSLGCGGSSDQNKIAYLKSPSWVAWKRPKSGWWWGGAGPTPDLISYDNSFITMQKSSLFQSVTAILCLVHHFVPGGLQVRISKGKNKLIFKT